jgi:NAD(P)-dependent dehydrogenase (short-subunit alcohol dehydrogenase family)
MAAKRILMTGASSGIGAATAALFTAAGDEVVSLDIKAAPAAVATHLHCDMGDPDSIEAAVGQLEGNFDALLNIAGVPGTVPADLIMRVNTLGLKHFTERVFERLNEGGAIVNIASIAGFNWARHLKDINELLAMDDFAQAAAWCNAREMDSNTAYHFSKECVVVYTLQLAGAALKRGLRANSISPGPVATPLLPEFKEQAGSGQLDWVIETIGRAAEPVDIANVVKYLATGASEFVNGQDIVVDRGFSAGLAMGWIDKNESPLLKARAAAKS